MDERKRAQLIGEIVWLNQQSDELEAELDERGDGNVSASGEAEVADVMKLLLATDGAGPAVGLDETDTNKLSDDVIATHLHQLASVTGIIFDAVDHALVSDGSEDSEPTRRYHLKGSVLETDFEVTFNAKEETKVIENLRVALPPECQEEFGVALEWIEATSSPLVFFQTFIQYAEENQRRAEVFQDTKDKFPEYVTLPLGPRHGWFVRIEGNGIAFSITWKIVAERDGRVGSSLSLVPAKASSTDSNPSHSLLSDAPEQFQSLVRTVGPHAAIASLAKVLVQSHV